MEKLIENFFKRADVFNAVCIHCGKLKAYDVMEELDNVCATTSSRSCFGSAPSPGTSGYVVYQNKVTPCRVLALYYDGLGVMLDLSISLSEVPGHSAIVKDYTVDDFYLTEEECEKALKGVGKNDVSTYMQNCEGCN